MLTPAEDESSVIAAYAVCGSAQAKANATARISAVKQSGIGRDLCIVRPFGVGRTVWLNARRRCKPLARLACIRRTGRAAFIPTMSPYDKRRNNGRRYDHDNARDDGHDGDAGVG